MYKLKSKFKQKSNSNDESLLSKKGKYNHKSAISQSWSDETDGSHSKLSSSKGSWSDETDGDNASKISKSWSEESDFTFMTRDTAMSKRTRPRSRGGASHSSRKGSVNDENDVFGRMMSGLSAMIYGEDHDDRRDDDSSSDEEETDTDTDNEAKILSSIQNRLKGGGSSSKAAAGGSAKKAREYGHGNSGSARKRYLGRKSNTVSISHDLDRGMGKLRVDNDSICSELYSSDGYSSTNSFDTSEDETVAGAGKKDGKFDPDDTVLKGLPSGNNSSIQKYDYNSDKAELYRAIDVKNWDRAVWCLKKDPKMATYWVYRAAEGSNEVMWVFLPIHAACFSAAPLYFVKSLVAAFPKSVGIAAPEDKLPLHIACETAANYEVVNALVNAFPESLYHVDMNGNTPLQLCVFSMSGKNRARVMKILTKAAAGKTVGRNRSPRLSKIKSLLNRGGRKSIEGGGTGSGSGIGSSGIGSSTGSGIGGRKSSETRSTASFSK